MSNDNEDHFQFLAEHSVDIIIRCGMDRVFQYVSPSSFRILGWEPEEMKGRAASDFILAEDLPLLAAAAAEGSHSVTLRMLHKDGFSKWMDNCARLVTDPTTGEPSEWVVTLRDATVRKMMEEKLTALAMIDGLTGLANRRAFDEALGREWKRTLRQGTQISLLILDIDHFKHFNDQYGHQVGDDCLRLVAQAVLESVRDTDLVARYGGEEIVVILPATETAGAMVIAEKVRTAIEGLRMPHQGSLEGAGKLTASIGAATAVARLGGSVRMPETLLMAADNALYKAKHSGRNCVATSLLVAAGVGEQASNLEGEVLLTRS